MKASDNLFPYVTLVPAVAPAAPATGAERVYLDSGDGKLKRKNSAGTVATIEGGGGASSHAEYTSSFTSTAGALSNLGTPTVDAAKSTDTTFVTPAANGSFVVASAGVYHVHAFLALPGTTWGAGVRIFSDVLVNGTLVGRNSLATNANEDSFTVALPGFYAGAGQTIQFEYFRSAGTSTVSIRYFISKIG